MSFPRYPTYKPSGVEWLGEVPGHWEVTRLGRVTQCKGGAGFPDEYQGQVANELPFFKVADLARAEPDGALGEPQHTISRETAGKLRAHVFAPSTIVFAKVGAALLLQRYRWIRRAACLDNNMMGMSTNSSCLSSYLLYVLPALDLSAIVNPGAVPSINESQISNQQIALPPRDEQHAIAAFLDRETARIDALVAEQERLIELLREKRQAVISHAVTKGLDPSVPMKDSGVEWCGVVPEHWEVTRLGREVSAPICYGVLVPDEADEGVPMLRIMDVHQGQASRGELVTISAALSEQYRRTLLSVGDLVLSVVGTIGETLRVSEEMAGVNLSRALARLQFGRGVALAFADFFLQSHAFAVFTDLTCVGSAQKVLNIGDLARTPIVLPPLPEQDAIAAFLDTTTSRLDALTTEAERAIALLQERRAALISAAVTGQIDVRGLAPEVTS